MIIDPNQGDFGRLIDQDTGESLAVLLGRHRSPDGEGGGQTVNAPTRHDILALPAGAVLNAWVAHLVFGWNAGIVAEAERGNPFTDQGATDKDGGHVPPLLPDYSRDVAAAWLVVEKLTRDGWGSFGFDGFGHGKKWLAGFGHQMETADTFMLATCRAALLAVTAPGPSA